MFKEDSFEFLLISPIAKIILCWFSADKCTQTQIHTSRCSWWWAERDVLSNRQQWNGL